MSTRFQYGSGMKCDLGEIACAIDRLTDAVGSTQPAGSVAWFDVVTRVAIPLGLGLLTLYVAWGSQKIARESVRVTRQAQSDEKKNRQFRDRVALSEDLNRLLDARRKEALGSERGFWLKGDAAAPVTARELSRQIKPKAAVSNEVGAETLFDRCDHAFEVVDTHEFRGGSPQQQGRLAAIRSQQIETEIRTWVQDPYEFLANIEDYDQFAEFPS